MDSGEWVWSYSSDADFDKVLKTAFADVMQYTLKGDPDHILALRFSLKLLLDKWMKRSL